MAGSAIFQAWTAPFLRQAQSESWYIQHWEVPYGPSLESSTLFNSETRYAPQFNKYYLMLMQDSKKRILLIGGASDGKSAIASLLINGSVTLGANPGGILVTGGQTGTPAAMVLH